MCFCNPTPDFSLRIRSYFSRNDATNKTLEGTLPALVELKHLTAATCSRSQSSRYLYKLFWRRDWNTSCLGVLTFCGSLGCSFLSLSIHHAIVTLDISHNVYQSSIIPNSPHLCRFPLLMLPTTPPLLPTLKASCNFEPSGYEPRAMLSACTCSYGGTCCCCCCCSSRSRSRSRSRCRNRSSTVRVAESATSSTCKAITVVPSHYPLPDTCSNCLAQSVQVHQAHSEVKPKSEALAGT